MEDQQIIEMYLQRNENAVAQTERKYTKYCRSIAIHIMHCPEDTDKRSMTHGSQLGTAFRLIFRNAFKLFLADSHETSA